MVRASLILLAVVMAAGHVPPAAATGLTDAVPGADGTTYLDLLREVVPDLTLQADGSAAGGPPIPFRDIADPACLCDRPEEVRVTDLEALPFRSAGASRLLVLAHVSEEGWTVGGTTLLLLFDPAAGRKLLDLANVGLDESVRLADRPLLTLSSSDEVVLVESSHWNSNQTYLTTRMIFAPADELVLIDDVFTLWERLCAFERVQSPAFRTRDATGRAFADISVQVKDEVWPRDDADCDELPAEPASVTVEATYRWDTQSERYLPDSDALERLAREAAERF